MALPLPGAPPVTLPLPRSRRSPREGTPGGLCTGGSRGQPSGGIGSCFTVVRGEAVPVGGGGPGSPRPGGVAALRGGALLGRGPIGPLSRGNQDPELVHSVHRTSAPHATILLNPLTGPSPARAVPADLPWTCSSCSLSRCRVLPLLRTHIARPLRWSALLRASPCGRSWGEVPAGVEGARSGDLFGQGAGICLQRVPSYVQR